MLAVTFAIANLPSHDPHDLLTTLFAVAFWIGLVVAILVAVRVVARRRRGAGRRSLEP